MTALPPAPITEADLQSIEEIEHLWIPLPDGCRLAARLWRPRSDGPSSAARTLPVVLEYLPYRKRDFMRARDEAMHRYFALAGFASVRVDLRGTGDSEGVIGGEYTEQELQDGEAVIAWLAARDWCNGAVGMMGISWGGFNALQMAARQPPALKAIISLCASDDRYSDDAHYMGGCLLNENLQWGSILMLYNALPPDPQVVGKDWRRMWHERLEALKPYPAEWMAHPDRDDFWRHGSVCEDYAAIRCPVLCIGGWADGYTNAVLRLLEHLSVPRRGIIGPWAHVFPQDGVPGPAIGFLQEAVRWWRQWLCDENTGVLDDPMLRVWLQDPVPPRTEYEHRPGRWLALPDWPSEKISTRRWHLGDGRLHRQPRKALQFNLTSPQTTGLRGGEWCAFGAEGEMPRDQRPDDGGSLVFNSARLKAPLEVLGEPVVCLHLASDQPGGLLAVRLNDVAPDGSVLRVSYGLLNLQHREGHDRARPLQAGTRYAIRVPLNHIGHRFAAGHRIRLSLSTSYWPIVWPAVSGGMLTIDTEDSGLWLPILQDAPTEPVHFHPPVSAPGSRPVPLRPIATRRELNVNLVTNETLYTLSGDGGEFDGAALARIEAIDLEAGYRMSKHYRIREDDALSAVTEMRQEAVLRRDDWDIRVQCETRLQGEAEDYLFTATLTASEDGTVCWQQHWDLRLPRGGY